MSSGRLHIPDSSDPDEQLFATVEDYAYCQKLHRKFGTTYYFATLRFPSHVRRMVHAVYGFVRVPDEWVDNPGDLSPARQQKMLQDYRSQLLRGMDGVAPDNPAMRAFVDVARSVRMNLDEPLCFLDAMAMDLNKNRYQTYEELEQYMRGSATAVGMMMVEVMGAKLTPKVAAGAQSLAEAMQMTNFLRDIREDLGRNRVYMPQDELAKFGLTDKDLADGVVSENFTKFMKFQIERTKALYSASDDAILELPKFAQRPVRLARILYAAILDKIEAANYNVFEARVGTSRLEKLKVAFGFSLSVKAK